MWLSVDPLAEKFPAWNPYHYVHNNPINLVDPTGMSADGWIINEKSGEAKFSESYDGMNTPDGWYYGSAIIGDKTIYNADGTHQSIDSGSENCVSCHHTANFGDFDISESGPYLQGSLNILGGLVGTTAATAYVVGTEGVGAAFGGATALALSVGQISIGISQIGDAWREGNNQILQNSNSIPGYGARLMNSPYSDIIDASSGLYGGALSGGVIKGILNNSRNIMNGNSSLRSAYEIYDTSQSVYDTKKAIEEYIKSK